jgi:YqjK-like protein
MPQIFENNMNKKLLTLAQRRECLLLEAEAQRLHLAQAIDAWRAPLALADHGLVAIRFLKEHPVWLACGSAILLKLVRPSRIGKWLSRGLFALQLVRKLQSKF